MLSAVVSPCWALVDYSANTVLGQDTFATNASYITISSITVQKPEAVTSGGGRIYIADTGNHRVLWWDSASAYTNGRGADGVIGQADMFANSANRGGAADNNTFNGPSGVVVDASGNVWVTDYNNNRILRFPAPVAGVDATADLVLGQTNFSATSANRGGAAAANTLRTPHGIALDSSGNVWVADYYNNRVMKYTAPFSDGMDASLVLGQANFASVLSNRGGSVAANTLYRPYGVRLDSSDNIWVADTFNNRVLKYSSTVATGEDAVIVIGQADFTSNALNRTGSSTPAANTLHSPRSVFVDSSGRVWVSDYNNNRVLRFPAPGIGEDVTATLELGQEDFSGYLANRIGSTTTAYANTLYRPYHFFLDSSGDLWLPDTNNNRVLKYTAPSANGQDASLVLGQPIMTKNDLYWYTPQTLTRPYDVAFGGGRVYVADREANRVLWWESSSAYYNRRSADGVLGQATLYENKYNRTETNTPAANTLRAPTRVMVDSDSNVWVADGGNHRVLRFAAPTAGVDASANLVLGQADFSGKDSNRGGAVAANTLSSPSSLQMDSSGKLWLADSSNNRVLRYSTFSNGSNADLVIGQDNFTSNTANRGIGTAAVNSLNSPSGLAFDSAGRLWVADTSNNRVLRFSSPAQGSSASADLVLGQADFISRGENRGGSVAANTLYGPLIVQVDGYGYVLVADHYNHRILRYSPPQDNGQAAQAVLGQANFTTRTSNRGGSIAANTLSQPIGISVDASSQTWVSDYNNSRVLRYSLEVDTYTVSGTLSSGGSPLSATVTVSGGASASTASDGAGAYSFALVAGPSYTLTPSKTGYAFSPVSRSTDSLGAVWASNDFTGTPQYTISGTITVGGNSMPGVLVSVTGSSTTSAATDGSGNYSFTFDGGGNYTLTPSSANFSFTPANASYTNLAANQTGDFTATLNTYTVSGTITDGSAPLSGVTVTVSGSASASVDTDGSGNYSLTLSGNGNYTLTPGKANYTFTPASVSTTTLSGNWANNFTAALNTYTVSGTVSSGGSGLSGVTVTVSGGASSTATTDGSGNYSFTLNGNGNYTLTPSKTNYVFTPASVSTTTLSGNWTGNDFSAGFSTYTVSGTISAGGSALSGVTVTVSGDAATSATTDASGNYSLELSGNGNYTLTPSKTNYTFTPASVSTATLSANWTANNFTATRNTFTVSGTVASGGSAQQGATVTVSGDASDTATTDSSGNYSFTLNAGGSYTLTPSKANYTFTPASVSTATLSASWTNNFTSTLNTYTVSGAVSTGGSALSGVTVTVSGDASDTATTDSSGNYSFTLNAGGSYTLTPSKANYTFTPASVSTATLSANWTGNNFTASLGAFSVSGYVKSAGVAVSGLTVTASGSASSTATTDAAGYYSFLLLPGSYTITPGSGYAMTPLNYSVTVAAANVTGRDFVAANIGGRSVAVIGGPQGYAQPTRGHFPAIKLASPPESGQVMVKIYTARGGRLVRSLSTSVTAGTPSELIWDCLNTSGEMIGSGIYLAVISGAGYGNEKIKIGVLK